jgi:hypothetical protein
MEVIDVDEKQHVSAGGREIKKVQGYDHTTIAPETQPFQCQEAQGQTIIHCIRAKIERTRYSDDVEDQEITKERNWRIDIDAEKV